MLAMTDDRNEISRNALAQAAAAEGKRLRRLDDAIDEVRRWHLVQIVQMHFARVKLHLDLAGYKVYAPEIREFVLPRSDQLSHAQRRQRHMFKRERLSPLFGSYRFVRFADHDPWHDLFRLLGVHGIAVEGGVPVPVPDELIDRIKAKEVNGAIAGSTPVKALIFSVGDTAKVNEGPFMGFDGTIERVDESGRIRLLLEMFAGVVPVDLTADQIDKVTE